MHTRVMIAAILALLTAAAVAAQAPPPVIPFTGVALDDAGQPRTGTIGLTFGIYEASTGGDRLWVEAQQVTPDAQGRYTVLLGVKDGGVPLDIFQSGRARWLGIMPDGQAEQPRALLAASVPYALKAGDANTLAGLPVSAFLHSERPLTSAGARTSLTSGDGDGGGGVASTETPITNDQVIPDDLIVQGSICAGLDCVSGESFGFDTIRLKENNLRIKFEDTSTTAGFPSNDWQILVNESGSGERNIFAIDDLTGGKVPFIIKAGAPTGSLFVESNGNIGLGTESPILDIHLRTLDTPAARLEQTSGGGFTAQTWDIAGNEANFFVRDVTGGSRLPFRIRPGAPTSSVDIAASGNVGIGTASPDSKVHVQASSAIVHIESLTTNVATLKFHHMGNQNGFFQYQGEDMLFYANSSSTPTLTIKGGAPGNVGIGVTSPAHPLHMASGAHVTGGGVWTNASSRALKEGIHELETAEALSAFEALQPVTFVYTANPEEHHVGFIAEDVPQLVATNDRKGLAAMDIVAVLTKVVQQQQASIRALSEHLAALEQGLRDIETAGAGR